MTIDEFQSLNPQMNRPVILAAGTPQILLPYDNANRFVTELPLHRGPLTTWTTWTAPRTMKSAEAAQAVGMGEDEFREVNRIPARMLIKSGSTLLVPRRQTIVADVSSTVADNATLMLAPDAPPLRKVTLRAGRRDSVDSIAKRYRVSASQVAQWNDVGTAATFAPGKPIVVYVAGKSSAASMRTAGVRAHGSGSTRVAATSKGSKAGRAGHVVATHKHEVARN
jgi:membrane-bound lytic murein transglycosylase D